MASLNARRKPNALKTYGGPPKKSSTFARPSQQTAKSSRTDLSRSVSDVPAIAPQDEYDPYSFPADDISPEPLSSHGYVKTELSARSKGPRTNIARKRKIAQVYPANGHGQDPLSEDSSPISPRPKQRSRVSSPADNVAAPKGKTNGGGRRLRSTSVEIMDHDAVTGTLSSPPPTPIAPKERKAHSRGASKQELPFSPNTMHAFGSMKVADTPPRQHQIPVRPKLKPAATTPAAPRGVSQVSRRPPTSAAVPQPAKRPRRKLIDALVEQMEDSDDPADQDKSSSQVSWTDPVVTSSQTSESLDSQSQSQTPRSRRTYGSAASRTFARSGSSLKRTYGQKVTLLEEDNLLDAFVLPEESGFSARRRLELTPKKLIKPTSDPEEDASSTATPRKQIKDIHELKQAGANSRVADEMMDVSTRIGQPSVKASSDRRGALLEIAEKAQQKDYRQSMCDYGIDAMMLKNAGDETDLISGYLISAVLLQMLASSTAPHIIQILQSEDAGHLFGRLLQRDEDMKQLVRDRKSNLSKRHQALILATQAALLDLPIWEPIKPTSTSPRTVALRCLEMIIAQDAHLGSDDALFPPSVTKGLFDSLMAAQEAEFWDNADAHDTFDVRCALSVLEYHAVKVMEAQSGERLAAEYLPSVADAFGIALQGLTRHNDLESLLLKLVLNMTNSSVTAPEIFVTKGLLLPLSMSICANFTQSLSVVTGGEEWTDGLIDGLVLRLGILINFAEQNTAVREAVFEHRSPGGSSPTTELIRLFLANHRTTAEADSEAKSQLNVAFGYLSVLLGYLCLYAPIRKTFKASHTAKSLGPLVNSIQEFISHHRAMEASLLDAGADDPRGHGGYTERLQGLVDQLDADAAYD